jgi:uncharacterized protein RhaS with RHS repeats
LRPPTYYRARYFDPAAGTFVSEDPLGFGAGDENLYRYVFNSPTNFTDPSGEAVPALLVLVGLFAFGSGIDAGVQLALNGGNLSEVKVGDVLIRISGTAAVLSGGIFCCHFSH